MISRLIALLAVIWLWGVPVQAQAPDDIVYIQVQARTSLTGAQDGVRDFAERFENVNGFALGGGWYGVALGPYRRDEATQLLADLLRARQVPADAYIEDTRAYGQQFWPIGAQPARAPQPVPQTASPAPAAGGTGNQARPEPQAQAEPPAPEPAPEIVDETPREARASERALDRDQRMALQIALQWAGFYNAGIDGAFGRGTRRAMQDWQRANGFEPTGVLTTLQRAELLRQYNAVLDGMDLQVYADPRAGISIELPLGAVAFDRYEAPFALFGPRGELQARALLISQPGDRNTLNGLYEIMQTLEIVPIEGARERRRDGFVLTGANDRIVSHTEVRLLRGEIKGFSLIWPAGDEERRSRILTRMQDSFTVIDGVLDPAAVSDDGQTVDLVSGLKIRQPRQTASGFFIDSVGRVLTSSAGVEGCARVTLNGVHEARVVASDAALGLAVLRPEERLAPRGVAAFNAAAPRIQAEIAVAGFSFGGVLTAPTLTFGTLADLRGLAGEEDVKRLQLASLPGDAGGPVFDAGGAVVGMLLPRDESGSRVLPEGVSFAAKTDRILEFLGRQGLNPVAGESAGAIAPEDLTALAADMTVLVSCWD